MSLIALRSRGYSFALRNTSSRFRGLDEPEATDDMDMLDPLSEGT